MRRRQSEINGTNKEYGDGRTFLVKWSGVTAVAWSAGLLLGFLLAGVFTELLATGLGQPNDAIAGNIVLGFVLGTTVGWCQRFVLRNQIALPAWWFLVPGVVLAGGYALLEGILLPIIGVDLPAPVPLWSISQTILYALAGGLSSLLQSLYWPKRWTWIVANVVGWGGAITLIQQMTNSEGSGMLGFFLFMSGLILSGVLLGTASGLALMYESKQTAFRP